MYKFDRFTFYPDQYLLVSGGDPIDAEPRTLEVLNFFIENRERVVSRSELLEALWENSHVTDGAINRHVQALRRALGDSGRRQKIIRTIHGRGYQFIARVETLAAPAPQEPAESLECGGSVSEESPPDQPSSTPQEALSPVAPGEAVGSESPVEQQPKRRLGLIAAGGLLLMLGLAGVRLLDSTSEPLVVAVPRPLVEGSAPSDPFAASLDRALKDSVAALRGVSVDGYSERSAENPGSAGRSVGAPETIYASAICNSRTCDVQIQRLDQNGSVVRSTHPFEVAGRLEDSRALASAVWLQVRSLYPERKPRLYKSELTVSDADYDLYFSLWHRVDQFEPLEPEELDELLAVLDRSPKFLEAHLLAASLLTHQGMHDEGLKVSRAGMRLAPSDPRPIYHACRALTEAEKFAEAADCIADLRGIAPGDARADFAEAILRKALGEPQEAIQLLEAGLSRREHWQYRWRLADLYIEAGQLRLALLNFRNALLLVPNNKQVQRRLAQLELICGELSRARELYDSLLNEDAPASVHSERGMVSYLERDLAEAATYFTRALELEPSSTVHLLNLADALWFLGRTTEAKARYLAVVEQTDRGKDDHRLERAQALARLGRSVEAVRLGSEAINSKPASPLSHYQFAVVSAAVGDEHAAIAHLALARQHGLSLEWLLGPDFESLHHHEAFEQLTMQAEDEIVPPGS